jgi:hypothetical protein
MLVSLGNDRLMSPFERMETGMERAAARIDVFASLV